MKYASVFPGFLLVVSLIYLTRASPRSPHEPHESDIVVLVHNLPWELRDLYDLIIDPTQDDIKKENCIWRAFELLKHEKYNHYVWFYDWLVYQSGDGHVPGRRTPHHGGLTPRGGPGGRTRGGPGGRTRGRGGPGGRTKKRGGPGGRTRGGGRHRGRH